MNEEQLTPFDIFHHLTLSAFVNSCRGLQAEIVFLKTEKLLNNLHNDKSQFVQFSENQPLLEEFIKVSRTDYESFVYVYNASLLTYFTSVFDTYLSDITKFLLLMFPKSIPKDLSIPSELLFESKSKWEAINRVVENKAFEISYKSFTDRILYIKEKFGLNLEID